jgi:2-polyprenyl-3-methyl-5-hydroxy-6-metoxy-1,4-benzoquinol methylase
MSYSKTQRSPSKKDENYLDSQRIMAWWNNQAQSNPDSAGILPMRNEQFIGMLYRQEAEWLHFRRVLPLTHKTRVLELGCGAGRWSLKFAPLVKRVVGVDFSENMIQLARAKNQNNCFSHLEFHVAPVQDVILNEMFDIIYLSGVTSYLTDEQLRQTLRNTQKMLATGGYIVERTSISLPRREVFDDGDYQGIYRTIQEEISLFDEFGFHIIYRASSYTRMYLPRLITKNRGFQKLMQKGIRYFPRISILIIRCTTWIWEKFKPYKSNLEKRSHDFLIFKKKNVN